MEWRRLELIYGTTLVHVLIVDGYCRTSVHAAAYSDHCEALQMLISNSGDITRADAAGRTPLMYAGMAGRCRALGES